MTHLSLYPQLSENIIILNAVQEFGQTPERIGFDDLLLILCQGVDLPIVQIITYRHHFLQENHEEWSNKIIYPLNIA